MKDRPKQLARVVASLCATSVAIFAFAACSGESEDAHTDGDIGNQGAELAFSASSLLSDADFTDTGALTAAQIQSYLEHPCCGTGSSLATYSQGGKTAAEAISEAATASGINPIEFLVRLQVERSLICQPASTYKIDEALSCGCPDNSSCSSMFAGFDKQVTCAGDAFKKYLTNIKNTGDSGYGWGPHKTTVSSDKYKVTPDDAATAALYTYTPWVYNGGNYLHWQVWNSVTKCLGYKGAATKPETKPTPAQPLSCSAGADDARQLGCTTDEQCNHGTAGTGYICSTGNVQRGTCIDACHADIDCPEGSTCDTTQSPHYQCTNAPPSVGTACTDDSQCTGGADGASRVCSAGSHKCIVGCHSSADCGTGKVQGTTTVCDMGLATYACVSRKELGDDCTKDTDCSGGVGGTSRVCNPSLMVCDDGCHGDFDCDVGNRCNAMTKHCEYVGQTSASSCRSPSSCPVLEFPSGIKIQSKTDAVLEASYKNHVPSGQTAPHCFLDVDDLLNPDTSEKYDYQHVKVSDHFALTELVGSEVQSYSRRVLLTPDAVAALESFRDMVGDAFTPTSGFRSPAHQEATCMGLCKAKWCPGTCAQYSQHMFGDAFDLPVEFYSYHYASVACMSGFKFAYDEAHTHLHADTAPRSSSGCVIQFD